MKADVHTEQSLNALFRFRSIMKRSLTEEERARIASFISSGDRIEAIGDYITITGCGLTEAQKEITALAAELHETSSIKAAKKQQTRRSIFRRIVGKLRK